jgi:hypothetical protein
MNSEFFYQSLLSEASTNKIKHSNQSLIYINDYYISNDDISITDLKDPSYSTFSLLEESNTQKSGKFSNFISLLKKKKKKDFNHINLTRFMKPSYKKYTYMDLAIYNNKVDAKLYEL